MLTFVSTYFWYKHFSHRSNFSVKNIKIDYIQWTQQMSDSIRFFMIIAPLAFFLKCLKLLHIFEYYSPSFGLLLASLLTGSRRALSFLFYITLLGVPFVFMSHLLLSLDTPISLPSLLDAVSSLAFLFFNR